MPKKPVTKEKALKRLEALCSRSEQCEFDLNRKMVAWGISSSERNEVIRCLKENRFIDDARYARSFARDKARFSAWGPNKIKAELIRKKIKSLLIAEALHTVEQEVWKNGLLRCAVSKAKNMPLTGEDGWKNCQKLLRFILSRGFPISSATKVVSFIKKRQEGQND